MNIVIYLCSVLFTNNTTNIIKIKTQKNKNETINYFTTGKEGGAM
jgi:hypothetical protein